MQINLKLITMLVRRKEGQGVRVKEGQDSVLFLPELVKPNIIQFKDKRYEGDSIYRSGPNIFF